MKVTVYEITGPLNVPGYARYTYKADVPGAATPPGTWTAQGGSATAGAANQCQILWGEGGKDVSYAIFKPDAQFQCKRDVNVVQIKLSIANSNLQPYGNVVQGNGFGTGTHIRSNSSPPAMSATITVAEIHGPSVNSVERGERYISLGFIQNINVVQTRGAFDDLTPPQYYVCDIEKLGTTLDTDSSSTAPWYDTSARGYAYANLRVNPALANATNSQFVMFDTPQWDVVDNLRQNFGGRTDQVDRFLMLTNFNLYFAVHTTEAANGSELVYTQRASSTWAFDGTGPINNAGVWSGPRKVTVGKFSEVSDGTVVPVTTGTIFNVELNGTPGTTWKWEKQ